jgi:hypothetical protein
MVSKVVYTIEQLLSLRPNVRRNFDVITTPKNIPLNLDFEDRIIKMLFLGKTLRKPIKEYVPRHIREKRRKQSTYKKRASNSKPMIIGKNAWRPKEMSKDDVEETTRQVASILNKITSEKYDILSKQLFSINIENRETLENCVNIFYKNVLVFLNRIHIPMYVRLCKDISSNMDCGNEFIKNVLNKCQTKFQKSVGNPYMRDEGINNAIFLSELHIQGILDQKKICLVLRKYLSNPIPELSDIETAISIISIVGKRMDVANMRGFMDGMFGKLRTLSKSDYVRMREKFMIKDVIKLRINRWKK